MERIYILGLTYVCWNFYEFPYQCSFPLAPLFRSRYTTKDDLTFTLLFAHSNDEVCIRGPTRIVEHADCFERQQPFFVWRESPTQALTFEAVGSVTLQIASKKFEWRYFTALHVKILECLFYRSV